MGARKKNVFVVGLEKFNLRLLRAVRHADRYAFHGLLDYEEIAAARRFDMEALLDKARETLRRFPEPVDAIVGYRDFPTILMMAILRREFGLRGPTLECVLRCEHKYWSRIEQKKVVPAEVPGFALVDPFEDNAAEKLDLAFPFWIKPVARRPPLPAALGQYGLMGHTPRSRGHVRVRCLAGRGRGDARAASYAEAWGRAGHPGRGNRSRAPRGVPENRDVNTEDRSLATRDLGHKVNIMPPCAIDLQKLHPQSINVSDFNELLFHTLSHGSCGSDEAGGILVIKRMMLLLP